VDTPSVDERHLPSFSIVIETANLATADSERLISSLDTIARQTLAPATAREVVVLDSGEAPPGMLEALRARYPWIQLQRIAEGTDYGDQKAMSLSFVTGEVVVFADSDCLYEPSWLASMLEAFANHPEREAVAGETTVAITGPFTLAMGVVFFFPRFSYDTAVQPARGFYGNNVAIRRDLLQRVVFPSGLSMFRGQNVIYSRVLLEHGVQIWRQPRARALHSPPEGLRIALLRFYWTGRDSPRLTQVGPQNPEAPFQGDYEPYHRTGGRARKVIERVRAIARQQPLLALVCLPVALPIAAACVASFFCGAAEERLRMRFAIDPQPTG
jgi:glycosyltransferase involved in cell wall biosynthesis